MFYEVLEWAESENSMSALFGVNERGCVLRFPRKDYLFQVIGVILERKTKTCS